MGYSFGRRSASNLMTCDTRLQAVARRALGYGVMDFSVTEGHRSLLRQKELYDDGMSQIDGIRFKGKHNKTPSEAMDLLPYPAVVNGINVWNDHQRFAVLAGLIMAAAAEEGVTVRWGGDWDGDGNNADSTLHDMPHFELID
ncbi:MAG: peptidase [Oceanospirillaceae bacterium]|nr:peptidase [Oceanospirillaceae bacterium]|tara:strand:- start:234 stop:659 length:426 start_codon:yes stop_codon:yes gene_type:complete